ncbi:hypothetical protein GOP47_0005897 [Adiantum capillus-veneris]|uniref:Uncharacterized protein n=1 Tax=Adiantum capillus-veneris TaxID=13818 RepID=A0A9D4V1V8_ADICA|nr:hypothetical protein GOP47_0005897 [Adiantum capillus-veneris]
MSNEDGSEEKVLHRQDGPGSPPPYKPPPQFKEIVTPPLLQESLPDTAELWLVRIQDNQLKADEFKGKHVTLALNASDGKMGCFEDSKVRRVSRQVAVVRSLNPVALSRPPPNTDRLSSGADGRSNTPSHKQKHSLSILNADVIASRGKGSEIKQENQAVSASLSMGVGGPSTVESLQEDEERITSGKLGKSSKKSKRDSFSLNSEVELSPLASPQRDLEVLEKPSKKLKRDQSNLNFEASPLASSRKYPEVHDEQASLKKKSKKHKKIKQEESG